MICQSVVVKVASHVCKFGLFAPVILHIVPHVCRSGPSAPVGFHGGCPGTAARARSAQGASQFAACYAAVRLTHHSDVRPVHIMKTSQVTVRLCLRMFRDSRVQIRPFCPRRPFISLPRVQIMGFRPRRLSCMLSRTAARARSAQGTSQAEFLREGIFRCRAEVGGQGKLCGDGKPAGPDMPP